MEATNTIAAVVSAPEFTAEELRDLSTLRPPGAEPIEVEAARRALADVMARTVQAHRKATGKLPLGPGLGSPAHWATEAGRLADLTMRTARQTEEVVDRHLATLSDPF